MHSKSDNIEVMAFDGVNEVIGEFLSLLSKYQISLETTMGCSDFIFDCVNLMYYKCHKINFNRGGSYIDSPDCLKECNNKYEK